MTSLFVHNMAPRLPLTKEILALSKKVRSLEEDQNGRDMRIKELEEIIKELTGCPDVPLNSEAEDELFNK